MLPPSLGPSPNTSPKGNGRMIERPRRYPDCHRGSAIGGDVAGVTGLEPATSGVTGQRSNQLSYTPAKRCFRARQLFAELR